MSKLGGYLRLMRPVNCLMMGIAVLVGAALANPHVLSSWLNLVYGFFTGFTLTAASMAINDYYDREIDVVNEPDRPIPSGLIESKEAIIFAFILTAAGFTVAYLTNVLSLVLAVFAWTVCVAYTTIGKRSGLPGNFLVSTCVAIPFIYGSAVITNEVRLNVMFFAFMAFLSNTGREITKGIVDVRGDEMQGVKTLAVSYGGKTAAVTATIFFLLAVLVSPIPWFLNLVSFWFIPVVAVTDLGLVAFAFMLLKDYSREKARKIKNNVLLWFIIGLLAFAAGSIG